MDKKMINAFKTFFLTFALDIDCAQTLMGLFFVALTAWITGMIL